MKSQGIECCRGHQLLPFCYAAQGLPRRKKRLRARTPRPPKEVQARNSCYFGRRSA